MRLELVLCIVASVLLPSLCSVDVPITQHWGGGFQGDACFDITVELNGWTLTLHFDQTIKSLDVWVADVTETLDDGKTWVLTNKGYDATFHPGDQLCVSFQGHGDGDIVPVTTATIAELPDGGGTGTTVSPGGTSQPTTASTTSTTTSTTTSPTTTSSTTISTTPTTTTTTASPVTTSKPAITTPTTTKSTTTKSTTSTTTTSRPVVISGDGIQTALSVLVDWGGRFDAEVSFPLNENLDGWQVTFTFSDPIDKMDLDVGEVFSHSDDKLTWTVINTPHEAQFSSGTDLKIQFYGDYTYNGAAPTGQATLVNLAG